MSDKPSFQELSFLRVNELRPHEQIKSDRVEEVRRRIDEMNAVDYPILVDDQYHVILDGHHRYTALREKGLSRIPVIEVNYYEDSLVKLEARKNCPIDDLTKQDVLRQGLSPDVFPPKSTRHTLRDPIVAEDVALERLE